MKDKNINKKFNSLKIIGIGKPLKYLSGNRKTYICRCDCGVELEILAQRVVGGEKKNCGCKPLYPKEQRAITRTFNRYKTSANERGYAFELSREEFEYLIFQNCFYCNSKPSQERRAGKSEIIINGIDRKNNDKGYNKKNCVPCCKTCNGMKSDLSFRRFINHLKRIRKYVS